MPASINNNLPGSDLSIGSDTAVNNIIEVVDKIKQSAVASRRCFVVEVMGRYCGYLGLMSGIATGAERVYMHEEGVTLHGLQSDLADLVEGFRHGKRLALMIRNERANSFYTTQFMTALFNEESQSLFDARQAILGHLQQGGDPSPFDRIQATRFATKCIEFLIEEVGKKPANGAFIGLHEGEIKFMELEQFSRMVDYKHQRPKQQWWLEYDKIAEIMSQSGPHSRR
jgi:6-phosphofructokinase 1